MHMSNGLIGSRIYIMWRESQEMGGFKVGCSSLFAATSLWEKMLPKL